MILRVTRSLWSLLDPEIDFVARGLTKMLKSQPPAELPVDNSKAVAATQGSFYSFTPYDAVPRGPLNSWLFSGLVTGAASVVTWICFTCNSFFAYLSALGSHLVNLK